MTTQDFTALVAIFSIIAFIFYIIGLNYEEYPGYKLWQPIFFFLSMPFLLPIIGIVFILHPIDKLIKQLLK